MAVTVVETDLLNQQHLVTIGTITTASGTSGSFTTGAYDKATIMFQGTFGSGTYLLNGSWDGGTTWQALKDRLGNAVSATSQAYFQLGDLPPLLQISWSGATAPSVTVYVSWAKTYF